MSAPLARRRRTRNNHVGVCSDVDLFQAHGRLTRQPRERHERET